MQNGRPWALYKRFCPANMYGHRSKQRPCVHAFCTRVTFDTQKSYIKSHYHFAARSYLPSFWKVVEVVARNYNYAVANHDLANRFVL